MNHGSLFSGIGGFDLAAQGMGWKNLFHCEKEKFCQRILKYYWPDATLYDDTKTADFTPWRGKIDILSGGFPCQPFSDAGLKRGTEDDRYLWPEMLRAINEIRPRWIVGENVRGLVSWNKGLVFEQVHTDLESAGYEVRAFLIPACGVNAPHQRYRVWFVAHRADAGTEGLRKPQNAADGSDFAADTDNIGFPQSGQSRKRGHGFENNNSHVTNTTGKRNFQSNEGSKSEFTHPDGKTRGITADSAGSGMEGDRTTGQQITSVQAGPGLSGCDGPGTYWKVWPTESPLCSGNDGIPPGLDPITVPSKLGRRTLASSFPKWRNESIKGYGNAVVPQVVLQIFQSIKDYENLKEGVAKW